MTPDPDTPLTLLGDRTPAEFLKTYWQKRPLLIRQAIPGFTPPLDADELAGLACEEDVEARIVQGRDRDWSVRPGPFEEWVFSELPKTDWTLLVQDVNAHVPEADALLDAFGFLPAWRLDDLMVSYAAPGGSVGPHVDQYDVFVLQGAGRRRWRIDPATPADAALLPELPVKILAEFEPAEEWVLGPGDVLYLPPGVGHHGIGEDANCLTLSIGFRAPERRQLVQAWLEDVAAQLAEGDLYGDPALPPVSHHGRLDPATESRMERFLQDGLAFPPPFGDWLARYITEMPIGFGPEPPEPPWTETGLTEHLQGGGRLRRRPGLRLVYRDEERAAALYSDGQRYDCPAELTDTLALLGDTRKLPADTLREALPRPGFAAWLTGLCNAGLFEPEEPGDEG